MNKSLNGLQLMQEFQCSIYISDLTNELSSNSRLFSDDTSLFSVIRIRIYQLLLWIMNDLKLITGHISGKWVLILILLSKLKKLLFLRKIKKPSHSVSIFNNDQVIQTPYQKHLGFFLDEKLNFGEHLRYIANKVNTFIGLLRKL